MSFNKYAGYTQALEHPNDFYNAIDPYTTSNSIAHLDEKAQRIKKQPFEYFYEDIIKEDLKVDFSTKLSAEDYKNMKEDSKECLEICNNFYGISSKRINT